MLNVLPPQRSGPLIAGSLIAGSLIAGSLLASLLPIAAVVAAWALPASSAPRLALPAVLVVLWAWLLRLRPETASSLGHRRLAIAGMVLLSGQYLLWRSTATLNLSSRIAMALSLTLLAAEAILLGHGLLQLALAWCRQPLIAAEAARATALLERQIRAEPRQLPAVDVLVPSCGEPAAVVERTLRACLALDYPRFTVWLLDDAGQQDLAELCGRLGCRYRRRRDRRDAKAGNLNAALGELRGELVAVFDADVVPQRRFLRHTVGLFDDPRVALVQTPQSYMNADPVIRNLGLERWLMPDEEFFYRWIEPTRQGVDAVVCAGTSFLVRRSALERIGGFETGTPSEDLATGIRLTATGQRVLYLNEKLSAGLAPPTLKAMARQRSRWAGGTLQTLRTGASPLRIAGLSPLQRLAFLEGILHWLNVLPQLVLLLMPLSFGLLGVAPLQLSDTGPFTVALPLLLAQLLLARWFSHGARSALMPELYRWVFLTPLLQAVLRTAWGRPIRFDVTPKTAPGRRGAAAANLVLPLLLFLTLQVTNLALVLRGGAATLPLLWSGLSILLLLAGLRACRERAGGTDAPWFAPQELHAQLEQGSLRWQARITAVSVEGVELAWPAAVQAAPQADQPLILRASGLSAQPLLVLPCQQRQRGRLVQLGGSWAWPSATARHAFEQRLCLQPGCWPVRQAAPEALALLALLRVLLRPPATETWFRRSALPIRLEASLSADVS